MDGWLDGWEFKHLQQGAREYLGIEIANFHGKMD